MTLIGIALCGLLFVALFGRAATRNALVGLGRVVIGIASVASVVVFVALAYQATQLPEPPLVGPAEAVAHPLPLPPPQPAATSSLYVLVGFALCGLLLLALVGKETRRTILGVASVIGAICLAFGVMGGAAWAVSAAVS